METPSCLSGYKIVHHSGKPLGIGFNVDLPCDPAIPCLFLYPRKRNTCLHKDLCMDIHSHMTHNKKQKRPKYPTTDEWISKRCSDYLVKHFQYGSVAGKLRCSSRGRPGCRGTLWVASRVTSTVSNSNS